MHTKLEVGTRFPKPNPNGKSDCSFAEITTGFFDLMIYLNTPSTVEIHEIRKGKIFYGLFEKEAIPFFLLSCPGAGLQFDFSINILKVKNRDSIDDWLNGDGNALTIYLVDAATNKLLAMRMIGIRTEMTKKIRFVLMNQVRQYTASREIDKKIVQILKDISLEEMIRKGGMMMPV